MADSPNASSTFSVFRWTNEDTERLIRWRGENESKFTGKRNAAMKGFETFIEQHGFEGKVEAVWAKKKWENLKQKYKELAASEDGEITSATWKWFDLMAEVMGPQPLTPRRSLASSSSAMAGVSSASDQGYSGAPAKRRREADWAKRRREGDWAAFYLEVQEREDEKERQREEREDKKEREVLEREEKRERERREEEKERREEERRHSDSRDREFREWMDTRAREERQEREQRERESHAREQRLIQAFQSFLQNQK